MPNIELLEEQAVNAAVNHQWEQAIKLNQEIIKTDDNNLGAYLRLGFASIHINDLNNAKKYYRKALKIQPSNRIAQENIEKLNILEDRKTKSNSSSLNLNPSLFLDIPGKTKTVKLVNLGQKEELAVLTIGLEVSLKLKKRHIEVRTKENEYIGSLPDDVSRRLEYFIQEGSEYKTYIKETSLNDVVVFISEETKGKKVQQYPSFPQNPNVFMSDIQHDQDHDEGGDASDDEADDEWTVMGEDITPEERDEDLERIRHAEDEDEAEEE